MNVQDSGCEKECVRLIERRRPRKACVFIDDIDIVTFLKGQLTEGPVAAQWVIQSPRGPLTCSLRTVKPSFTPWLHPRPLQLGSLAFLEWDEMRRQDSLRVGVKGGVGSGPLLPAGGLRALSLFPPSLPPSYTAGSRGDSEDEPWRGKPGGLPCPICSPRSPRPRRGGGWVQRLDSQIGSTLISWGGVGSPPSPPS